MTFKFLLRLDAVHGILRGSAPALDDDGGKSDEAYGQQSQREEPPLNRDSFGKGLEPLTTDVVGDGGGNDEAESEQQGVVTAEQEQNLSRR